MLDLGKRWNFIDPFLVRYAKVVDLVVCKLVVTEIIPAEIPLGLDTRDRPKHGRYGYGGRKSR